jgi:hypothetical protein
MQALAQLYKNYENRFVTYLESTIQLNIPAETRLLIVIPCYDELPEETLESLGACSLENSRSLSVLLVFNHGANAPDQIREKHQKQQKQFDGTQLQNGLLVYAMAAFDLPKKHAGVGLARKIGMDAACSAFAHLDYDGLLVCLDADCVVSSNYLQALLKAEELGVNGLSIHFEHQKTKQKHSNEMLRYEIFLRYYINALRYTGFAHSHHTIGSSMAVRISKYLRLGGMNRRKAGEDFYFLHKLMPHPDFYDLTECTVHPQARFSERVPFGTGRAMLDMARGAKDFNGLYNPQIFEYIKGWLQKEQEGSDFELPTLIQTFLEKHGLTKIYQDLRKRSKSEQQYRENFSFWFDGFKMLKLVHFLQAEHFTDTDILSAVNTLFGSTCNDLKETHAFLVNEDLQAKKAIATKG